MVPFLTILFPYTEHTLPATIFIHSICREPDTFLWVVKVADIHVVLRNSYMIFKVSYNSIRRIDLKKIFRAILKLYILISFEF